MNNRHHKYNKRGVVMVEFAIILPLLVLLLFGITEIGRALYQQNILHRSLTVGERYLTHKEGIIEFDADNGICTVTADYTDAVDVAKKLILCADEDAEQTDCNDNAILPNLEYGNIDICPKENAGTCTWPAASTLYDSTNGLEACVITITAHAQFAGLFETMIPFTDIQLPDLNAKTEARYIGY